MYPKNIIQMTTLFTFAKLFTHHFGTANIYAKIYDPNLRIAKKIVQQVSNNEFFFSTPTLSWFFFS